MKKWWHYLLLGLFAWLLFMVWRMPATTAYGMVADSLGKEVGLAGISGTVWRGEVQQLQYRNRAVAAVEWRLSPWGLLLGFGLFAMVPLSASGFMLGTTVEIFGRHDFEPIERLALLNGLLGYFGTHWLWTWSVLRQRSEKKRRKLP